MFFRANKSVNLKSISPYITKKNETLKLKFVSYGQEINYNNLYSRNFHPSQNELNPLYNNPKNDIFLVKVCQKKKKWNINLKFIFLEYNFYFIGKKKTNSRCEKL